MTDSYHNNMNTYNVLYTHQKLKKAKVWQDGVLREVDSAKKYLLDEKRNKLDTVFSSQPISVGDELETDKYLISVEEVRNFTTDAKVLTSITCESIDQTVRSKHDINLGQPKVQKGFNPPRRVVTHFPKSIKPVTTAAIQQKMQPTAPILGRLFSSYDADTDLLKRTNVSPHNSENIKRQNMTSPLDQRTKSDILNLISSTSELKQMHEIYQGNYSDESTLKELITPPLSVYSQPEEMKTKSMLPDVTNSVSIVIQKPPSIWQNYLTQEKLTLEPNTKGQDEEKTESLAQTDVGLNSQCDLATIDERSEFSTAEQYHQSCSPVLTAQHLKATDTVTELFVNQNITGVQCKPVQSATEESGRMIPESPLVPCFTLNSIDWSDDSQRTTTDDKPSPLLRNVTPCINLSESETISVVPSYADCVTVVSSDSSVIGPLPSPIPYISSPTRKSRRISDLQQSLFSLEPDAPHCHKLNETSEIDLELDSPVKIERRTVESSVWEAFTASQPSPEKETNIGSIFDNDYPNVASRQLNVLLTTNLPVNDESSLFSAKLPVASQKLELHQRTIIADRQNLMASNSQRIISLQNSVDYLTLRFPPDPGSTEMPKRSLVIPASFNTCTEYKQVLERALKEYINALLFNLSMSYHQTLAQVDIEMMHRNKKGEAGQGNHSNIPCCDHKLIAKVVTVKKDGPNHGRMFYCCANGRANQCKFFQWADDKSKSSSSGHARVISESWQLESYMKSKNISFYCDCRFQLKSDSFMAKKFQKWKDMQISSSVFLKLPRKECSSTYSKGDLWVVSQSLNFGLAGSTFLARSVFYGPNSENELEIQPMAGYSRSSWLEEPVCYAIHAANLSTELTCLANLTDLSVMTLPVLPYILSARGPSRLGAKFVVPVSIPKCNYGLSTELMKDKAMTLATKHHLNDEQIAAVMSVADMFQSPVGENSSIPVMLIKGVFGAGKSYLLSVIVQFLTFALDALDLQQNSSPSKILVASLTNVAVDRVLLSLLNQGFTEFVRVGSMKKIAKPVLPHSLHATGSESQELRELQDMARDKDLSQEEKLFVRKSSEQHKMGVNRQKLKDVRVVGVTCAACSFPVLDNITFKIVLLDECSQMMEPVTLLPMKRASCEKVILVGDPRQLPPTLQGNECCHDQGLEQTLFDRLSLLSYPETQLCIQYRCHPAISALCNKLFYHGMLRDGVSCDERPALVNGLSAICLYSVAGTQQYSSDGSFYNEQESAFVISLITWLIGNGVDADQIGVIALYKAQVCHIRSSLRQALSSGRTKVRVSTVDAFQGGERDIIILSTVRTDQMGFSDDARRVNVALSRGKHHLLLVGHQGNLRRNKLWSQVITYLSGCLNGIQPSGKVLTSWAQS